MIWKILEEPLHKDGEISHEKEHMRSSERNKGMAKSDPKMRAHTEFKRNTQQIKEQDKCPPNQTKEEEIGNLPDKEF